MHDESLFTKDHIQTSGFLKVKEKAKGWLKFRRVSLYDVSGTAGAGGVFIHVTVEGSCAHPFVNGGLCGGDPDGRQWVRWPVQLHLSKAKYTFSNFNFCAHRYSSPNYTLNNFLSTPVFVALATVFVFHCSLLLMVKVLSGQWKSILATSQYNLWKFLAIIQWTLELLAQIITGTNLHWNYERNLITFNWNKKCI